MNRFPSKLNSLSYIKSFLGNEIKTIIDIGILTSTIELMRVFRDSKHVLVEPLSEYFERICFNYSNANIDFQLLKLAASNKKGHQKLKKLNHRPKLGEKYGGVTASQLHFGNNQTLEESEVLVETDTLDNIKLNNCGPFLIKIDVDGAEFQILEGLTYCDDVYVIVVESWVSRIGEFVEVMSKKGFNLYDITDLCYMRGVLSQVDLIFMNNRLMNNELYKEISPSGFGFTSAQEGNYYPLKEETLFNDEAKVEEILKIAKTGSVAFD